MDPIIVSNLTKVYKSTLKSRNVTALQNFSLSVPEGQIFGLLGPNGAGKTTLVKVLLSIVFATTGEAKIFGEDVTNHLIRRRIGYLPENHKFPLYLTGEGLLKFVAKISGYDNKNLNSKIDQLLALVKMTKWKKTKIRKYSKGMMQRLGLAQAMINNPDLIFLDEPTDGVDPIGRKEIRDILIDLKNQGKTIFLNSHLLSEVELITDRVAILNKGELIQQGTVEELTSEKETYEITLESTLDASLLTNQFNTLFPENSEKKIYSAKVEDLAALNAMIDKLRTNKVNIVSILPKKVSLEEMFITLINESDKKN
ncbi:MAG: ABC transporter ATP-binding protein [Flavobacterium sp.]|nr:ABC transporter ATP-binding protein [Flavobacterium sp.]